MARSWPYLVRVVVLAASLSICPTAQAGIMSFDDYDTPNHVWHIQFHDGYLLEFHASWIGTLSDPFWVPEGTLVRNGTMRATLSGDHWDGSRAHLDIRHAHGWPDEDGWPFSLTGFDAATLWKGFRGGIEVIGNKRGGGTVLARFDLTDTFATYLLPESFTNLESVRVQTLFSAPYDKEPGFQLDNLVIQHFAPEPSSLVLAGLGAAGLAVYGRRRGRASPRPSDD